MAKQLYEDGTIITQAFRFNSAGVTTPIDVRLVATGKESLYINSSSPTDAPLYGRAYRGMPIAIVDENVGATEANDVKIYVLKNELPFKFGSAGTINAGNFDQYWTEIGKSLNDEITEEIQPTIGCLVQYVKADNISGGKGVTITKTPYDIVEATNVSIIDAMSYGIALDTDTSTIDFDAKNKLTGGVYKIASSGSGNATTFKLQYKGPKASSYSDVAGSSTIEVHFEDWALNTRVADVSSNLLSTSTALNAKIENVSDNLATVNASVADISTKLVNIGSVIDTQVAPLNASVTDISTNKIPALVTSIDDVSTVANNAKAQATTNAATISAISNQLSQTITDLYDVSTQVDVLDTCVGDVYKFADENEKVIAAALTDMDLRLIGLDITSLFGDAANASITYDKRDADDLKYGRVFVKSGNALDPAAPRADVMRMINTDDSAEDQYIYYYDDYTIASNMVTIKRNYITGKLVDTSIVENVVRQRQWKRTSKKTVTLFQDT